MPIHTNVTMRLKRLRARPNLDSKLSALFLLMMPLNSCKPWRVARAKRKTGREMVVQASAKLLMLTESLMKEMMVVANKQQERNNL